MRLRPSLLAAAAAAALALPAAAQDIFDTDKRLAQVEADLARIEGARVQLAQNDAIASPDRLADLESAIRDLRGQVETLSNEVRLLKDEQKRLQTEFDFRLKQLEGTGGAPSADAVPDAAPAPGNDASGPDAGTEDVAAATPEDEPKEPGNLGTVPERDTSGGTAEDLYNRAMDFLTEQKFPEAQALFRQIAAENPGTEFGGQSLYWVADIHYVQDQFEPAAVAFAEVLKQYPDGGRGPESMLKLGLSLKELGRLDQACGALQGIGAAYPSASAALLQRAEREAKRAGCS